MDNGKKAEAVGEKDQIKTLMIESNSLRVTDTEQSLALADQAYTLAKDTDRNSDKIQCLLLGVVCLYRLGRFDVAKERIHIAMHLLKTHKDPAKEIHARSLLANILLATGELQNALELFRVSQEYFRKTGHRKNENITICMIANVYTRLGDLDTALEYHFQSLTISKEEADTHTEASTTHNIAVVYIQLEEFDRAMEYLTRSVKLFKDIGDKSFQANSLNSLANICRKTGLYEKGLGYAHQSLELNDVTGSKQGITTNLLTLGSIHLEMEHFEKAFDNLHKALALAKEINSPQFQADALKNLGTLFANQHRYKDAIDHFQNALKCAEKAEAMKTMHELYRELSTTYESMGEFENALYYQKEYQVTKESIFNEESDKRIQMLKIRYETEQRENENRLYRLKIDQQRREMAALVRAMTEQNELVQKLQNAVSKPLESMTKLTGTTASQLALIVQERKEMLNDGTEFHNQFNKAFPGFIDNLLQQFPDLTRQELNICAMIRLEMTSREIAKTLFITKRSVHWHRHQIRKKLGIDSKIDLGQFLKKHD